MTLFSGVFRILLGLPYVLFVPGYLLTTVLFPKNDNLESLIRIVLSVGLSIIIVPLIGLLHNYLLWPIDLFPMMLSLSFLNLICGLKQNCRIYSTGTFTPLVPDHMMREENYYLYKIKIIEDNIK
jgi:uncharacterized membrane protein